MGPNRQATGNHANSSDRAGERGIALILVLWLTLILSVVAASVTKIARSDLQIAFNTLEASRAEALADGGVYLALAALLQTQPTDPWPIDGSEREFVIAGELITVSIRDEAGKIDINTAPQELLAEAMLLSGVDEIDASIIANALIEERLKRDRSARVDAGISRVSRRRLVRPGRFYSIGELQAVAGLSSSEYARLRDIFTIYVGGRASARRSSASGMTSGPQLRSRANTYAIRSRVSLPSGASFDRYTVVRLGGRGRAGHQVLHWD